jgi:photosystem II stability/assembly factor-like uncharacterized protein
MNGASAGCYRILRQIGPALQIGIALCAVHLVACSESGPEKPRARLSFLAPPPSVVVQEPLEVVAVRVEDMLGNPIQRPGTEIRLALGANPGGASLLGTLTAKAGSDTALFDLVYLDKPGAGYTLVASADGFMPATMTVDVVPAAFTRVSAGVDGGFVPSIAASPAAPGGSSTLYANAGSLVFTSTDGGVSWAPPGIGGSGVNGVVADPQQPGVAYAIPSSPGARYLFRKTTDGGKTWRAAMIDGTDLQHSNEVAHTIAIDPTNSSILYVATTERLLHRSSDGGMTWTTSTEAADCLSIVIDPVTTSSLYCTGGFDGFFRSTDSGATWIAGTRPDASGPLEIFATPGALFARAGSQLYRSTDHAGSWLPLSIGNPGTLAFAPSLPQRIYLSDFGLSIRVSSDAGASFGSAVASLPSSVLRFMVDAQNPDLVYAATTTGVFRSSNAGGSWSPTSTGMNAIPITEVVPVSGAPGAWLASTPKSLVRTTDDGATWGPVEQLPAVQLAVDPANAANVYACGQQFTASTDGGAHFGAITSIGVSCSQLVVAGNTLFAAGLTLRKSIDRGVTWTDVHGISPSEFIRGVAVGDATGSVVLIGTSGGLYRSTDGGTTVQQVSSGQVNGLFSDPHAPSHVVVEPDPCKLSYSTDGGATFKPTSSSLLGCYEAYSAAGGTFYAGGPSSTQSLIRSTDGGASWSAISTAGLPTDLLISSIAVADDGTIFLGTSGGLYRSNGRIAARR